MGLLGIPRISPWVDERKLRCADVVRPGIGSSNYVAEHKVPQFPKQLAVHHDFLELTIHQNLEI